VLARQQLQHLEGFFIPVFNAFGGNHLGDDEPRAALYGKYPEGGVGDAGHGCQRQVVFKGYAPYQKRVQESGHGFKA